MSFIILTCAEGTVSAVYQSYKTINCTIINYHQELLLINSCYHTFKLYTTQVLYKLYWIPNC